MIYYSKNEKSNQTSVGSFWYNGYSCESGCDVKYSSYQKKFMYNDKLVIHLILFRSADEPIYHFGTAIIENDTLKLKVEEVTKFFYRFKDEIARKMCLYPTEMYFTSDVIPKHITVQFDSYGPIPLDSIKIRDKDNILL